MPSIRDLQTGRFLSGPRLCTCGAEHCAYHKESNRLSKEKHREKRRAENRQYYHEHKDKMRTQNKAWVKNNREFDRHRSNFRRRAGARLKKAEYRAVLDYYKPFCVYCDKPTTGIDHLYPLSRGGSGDSFYNLAPCCPKCNSIKGTRPIWTMLNREEVMMRV